MRAASVLASRDNVVVSSAVGGLWVGTRCVSSWRELRSRGHPSLARVRQLMGESAWGAPQMSPMLGGSTPFHMMYAMGSSPDGQTPPANIDLRRILPYFPPYCRHA